MQILYKGYWLEGTPQEITEFLTLNAETVVTTNTKVKLSDNVNISFTGTSDPLEDPLIRERRYMEDNGKKFLKNNKEELK